MIVKWPPELYSIHPVRFARPNAINNTPQAWAKLERDYQKFLRELREAVWCFGAERLEQDLHNIITGRQGRTSDEEFDGRLLKEHDLRAAKGKVNKTEFACEFRRQRHLKIKVRSLVKRLDRALDARERRIREKAEFDRQMRGSGTK
jgi:hypothetical protein